MSETHDTRDLPELNERETLELCRLGFPGLDWRISPPPPSGDYDLRGTFPDSSPLKGCWVGVFVTPAGVSAEFWEPQKLRFQATAPTPLEVVTQVRLRLAQEATALLDAIGKEGKILISPSPTHTFSEIPFPEETEDSQAPDSQAPSKRESFPGFFLRRILGLS